MESGVIKNPIDYFTFDINTHGTLSEESDGELRCELSHETLPIFIVGSIEYKLIDGKFPKDIYKVVISKAYSKLYDTIINGKSKPMVKTWGCRWFYPEWDSEKNLWFVMDKDGNRVYDGDRFSFVYDELDTD